MLIMSRLFGRRVIVNTLLITAMRSSLTASLSPLLVKQRVPMASPCTYAKIAVMFKTLTFNVRA